MRRVERNVLVGFGGKVFEFSRGNRRSIRAVDAFE